MSVSTTACTYCRDTLGDCIIAHSEDLCPLRKTHYCSYCAVYGHRTAVCRARPDGRPAYVEQLIGIYDRVAYGITTRTPLPQKEVPADALLVIKDDEQVIAAFLAARSIKHSNRKITKRMILEEYATKQGKRVVYV